mmetsp:Transcript_9167/g.24692  ORF Transcript_9167/g.24692 Transcript_9167/m.24692 type:complete len:86 (-) Transcript_9167:894-1151(-)
MKHAHVAQVCLVLPSSVRRQQARSLFRQTGRAWVPGNSQLCLWEILTLLCPVPVATVMAAAAVAKVLVMTAVTSAALDLRKVSLV